MDEWMKNGWINTLINKENVSDPLNNGYWMGE